MAIDRTGATMTGMLNKRPNIPTAPNMSALQAPVEQAPVEQEPIKQAPVELLKLKLFLQKDLKL
jgi:hypothetical protein